MSRKWSVLSWLALATFLGMSLWFSASAVTPSLIAEWRLSTGQAAWLTMAVQIGFVAGALLSALFNVADLWPPRKVFACGAWSGAALNLLVAYGAGGFGPAVALRFGTGMSLAIVYPVGMKIMATWTKEDRGLGLGLLVGALTVGSAFPHLVRSLGGIDDWRLVLSTVSACAAGGGAIAWVTGHLGPYQAATPKFRWTYLTKSVTHRPLRLANLGYLGHMWELYAMWTWIPLFLTVAYQTAPAGAFPALFGPERTAAFVTFVTIAVGGIGSLIAGRLGDRWGRTKTTMLSMIGSGACALTIGLFANGHPWIVTTIALIWGFTIVADSAQFSTAVSELGESEYIGTLLTTQTSLGFLLTLASIRLVPELVEWSGWYPAFAMLALGPLVGTSAMWLLGRSSAAGQLAGGRG